MGTPKDRVAAAKAAQPEVTVEVRTHAEAMVAARALADYLQRDPCYSDELLALVRLVGVLVEDGGEFTATLRALIATHDEYVALMATEGLGLEFTADAIDAIASIAVSINSSVENIGARRLQTVMERVLDEISFTAPDRSGEAITIDAAFVQRTVGDLAKNADLSRFIL